MKESQMSKAIAIAIDAHQGQKYGEFTYLYHLSQVDEFVIKMYGHDSGLIDIELDILRAIAYLHDVIEDTNITAECLSNAGICSEVVDAVVAMSKIDGQPYMAYIDVVNSCEFARMVKLADTAANLMNSLKDCNVHRINKYTKQYQLLRNGF